MRAFADSELGDDEVLFRDVKALASRFGAALQESEPRNRGIGLFCEKSRRPDVERRAYRVLERFRCIAFLVYACVHVFRRMDACMSGVKWMRRGR